MASDLVIRILAKDLTRKGFGSASREVKNLRAEVDKAARRMKYIGIAAAAGSIAAIKQFGDFDRKVREISTLLGDVTENDIKVMGDEIKKLSVEYGQSVDSMAKAKYDAISAGFTGAADSSKLLAQSAKLAVAGVSDVSQTMDV